MTKLNIVLCCLLLAWTASEAAIIKPKSPTESPEVSFRWPIATAPLLKTAPTIDGTVGREEWGGAAQSAPLISLDTGLAANETHTLWFGYTAEALYVAFQFGRPPYAGEPVSKTDPMTVWADDCIEFFLRPQFGSDWEYTFVGNAAGTHEEGRHTNNTDKKWTCDWTYKARKTDRGWEGEMKIPFASLGVASPKPGDVWEINPINNQKSPRSETPAWAYLKKWISHEDFGWLIFGGETTAVRLLQCGEVSRNEVGIEYELANFTGKDTSLEVRTVLYQPKDAAKSFFKVVDSAANPLGMQAEATEWLKADAVAVEARKQFTIVKEQTETVTIPANQSRRIFFAQESTRGSYVLHYVVRDTQTGAILAGGPLPFFRRSPLELTLTSYQLSAGAIEALADYRKVVDAQDGDRVRVELLDVEGKKVVREKQGAVNATSRQTSVDIPVEGLKPGAYTIRCMIEDANGKAKADREEVFNLAANPVWWGNEFGMPEAKDIVPEPWTPMKKREAGFEVWNRSVTLGDALQPSQIRNGTTEMLARPARLELQANDLKWDKPKQTKARKTGISYRQPFRAQNLTGELVLASEFDGFMKYTLRIEPKAGATLNGLVLEIPLRTEVVTHYHHGAQGTPSSYSAIKVHKGYGALPSEGLAMPFTDTLWVGNDELGFNWVAESDQWWSPAEAKKTVVVERGTDATVLRINFVNTPISLTEPVKFEWAILPTPMKPMNEELLHQLRYAQSGFGLDKSLTKLSDDTPAYIDALVESGANAFGQWAWEGATSLWNEDFSAPGYRPSELNKVRAKAFREATKLSYAKGLKWITVYAIWQCFIDWPDVGNLWREQALYPLTPAVGSGYLYCSARPFADWHVATLRKTIEETGINGIYIDSSPDPHLCVNLHHGHGYIDKDGKLHGTYPVFACREFHKRLYTLFHGEMLKGGLVYAHNSHFPFAAIESFVDVHHCGEGSSLERDIAIPKFYGRPFGLPVSFTRWNNPVYPETRMNSWRFVLQMDSTIKAHPSMVMSSKVYPAVKGGKGREGFIPKGYDTQGEAVWQVWRAQRNFPWEGSQWIPSWKADPYAKTGDPDLWVCLHLNPGKAALVVVSSFKKEPTTATVQLDWAKLGFDPQKVKIVDCITDEEVKPTAAGVTLPVLENRWRMLSIQAAAP